MISISNRVPVTYTIPTIIKRIKAGTTTLRGGSINGMGNVNTQWAEFASQGNNWVRSHHLEFPIYEWGVTTEQISQSWSEARANGCVVSLGLCDELGLVFGGDLNGFKVRLIKGDPDAELIYQRHIEKLVPLIQHPAVFMVSLLNEGAHLTTPEERIAFIRKWAPMVRAINPRVMISDAADMWRANSNPWLWFEVMKELDAFSMDFYGGQEMGLDSWIAEWHLKDATWWSDRAKELGKPMFVQEYGSYSNSPYYVENEVAFNLTAALNGWHTAIFAYNTGSDTDKYSIASDPNRRATMLHANYLAKNKTGLTLVRDKGQMTATGDKVEMPNRTMCRVSSYVWRTEKDVPSWARITKLV